MKAMKIGKAAAPPKRKVMKKAAGAHRKAMKAMKTTMKAMKKRKQKLHETWIAVNSYMTPQVQVKIKHYGTIWWELYPRKSTGSSTGK